jgi:hypothetical protein
MLNKETISRTEKILKKETRGRKKLHKPRLKKITISIEPGIIEFFENIGNGRLIDGLRNVFLYSSKNQTILPTLKQENIRDIKAKEFDDIINKFFDKH